MDFKFIDCENLSEKDLLELLNYNRLACSFKRKEIKKMQEATDNVVKVEEKKFLITETLEPLKKDKSDSGFNKEFEEEIDFYLENLLSLDKHNIDTEFESILPSRSNGNYRKIMMRLISEMVKEINEINGMIIEEDSFSKDELEELKEDIILYSQKADKLKSALFSKKVFEETKEIKHNKLIFIPTSFGNSRVLEEIKDIPREYYPEFLELFESIKDGSFKGVKRFVNNSYLKGACEVRGFGIRVVFIRLSNDCFGLLTAFIKRSDNDRGYRRPIELKVAEFRKIEGRLLEQIRNPNFIEENKAIEDELFMILGNQYNRGMRE